MTTISNLSNFTSVASSPITHSIEESTDKKVLDTALSILQQMSMKINLVLQNQDNLFKKFKELEIKLEQQEKEKKPAIPAPPPPPPSSSSFNLENWKKNQARDSTTEQKQPDSDSSNDTNCVNGAKTLNNNPAITLTQIQKQLETLRKPEDKNAANLNPKESIGSAAELTPQTEVTLRRSKSLCIKPKNTTPSLEDKKNEQLELSVAERKKMFENPSRG